MNVDTIPLPPTRKGKEAGEGEGGVEGGEGEERSGGGEGL